MNTVIYNLKVYAESGAEVRNEEYDNLHDVCEDAYAWMHEGWKACIYENGELISTFKKCK